MIGSDYTSLPYDTRLPSSGVPGYRREVQISYTHLPRPRTTPETMNSIFDSLIGTVKLAVGKNVRAYVTLAIMFKLRLSL